MAHAYHHADSSARRFRGSPSDYLAIHEWIDNSKIAFSDHRHRALRHHSFGVPFRRLGRWICRDLAGVRGEDGASLAKSVSYQPYTLIVTIW